MKKLFFTNPFEKLFERYNVNNMAGDHGWGSRFKEKI